MITTSVHRRPAAVRQASRVRSPTSHRADRSPAVAHSSGQTVLSAWRCVVVIVAVVVVVVVVVAVAAVVAVVVEAAMELQENYGIAEEKRAGGGSARCWAEYHLVTIVCSLCAV